MALALGTYFQQQFQKAHKREMSLTMQLDKLSEERLQDKALAEVAIQKMDSLKKEIDAILKENEDLQAHLSQERELRLAKEGALEEANRSLAAANRVIARAQEKTEKTNSDVTVAKIDPKQKESKPLPGDAGSIERIVTQGSLLTRAQAIEGGGRDVTIEDLRWVYGQSHFAALYERSRKSNWTLPDALPGQITQAVTEKLMVVEKKNDFSEWLEKYMDLKTALESRGSAHDVRNKVAELEKDYQALVVLY